LNTSEYIAKRRWLDQCAMRAALVLGAYMVVWFLSGTFAISNVPLQLFHLLLFVGIPVVLYVLVRRICRMAEDGCSFGQVLRLCYSVMFYASLILALVQFLFFKYWQPDYLANQIAQLVETLSNLKQQGVVTENQMMEWQEALATENLPTAIDMALQAILISVLGGLLMGIPIALRLKNKIEYTK